MRAPDGHDALLERAISIPAAGESLQGDLALPRGARALVVLSHGSGSSRHSPRNRDVAARMRAAGLGTLRLDLLAPAEEALDRRTRELRFDIRLLATRLIGALDWLTSEPTTARLRIGLFGASTGAAAALVAAVARPDRVQALVSRGGRPDLAEPVLFQVRTPTLLIVGGADPIVVTLNRLAFGVLGAPDKELRIVPRATHRFEEPGALEEVARLGADWFARHLRHGLLARAKRWA